MNNSKKFGQKLRKKTVLRTKKEFEKKI